VFAVFYCGYGMVHDKDVQEFVVMAFLGLSAACLGISSWEKLNLKPGTTTERNIKEKTVTPTEEAPPSEAN